MSTKLNLNLSPLKKQPPISPPPAPAPKAISNIKYQHNVNTWGDISGRNIIYDRTNLDGTIDQVCRVYDCCAKGAYWLGRYGLYYPGGPLIRPIFPHDTQEVTNYIMSCETRLKNYKPANVNVHRCGALLGEKRLPPPPPPKPTITQEITTMQTQIQQLTQKINELTQQNTSLSSVNEQQQTALAQSQQDLQRLLALLSNLVTKK